MLTNKKKFLLLSAVFIFSGCTANNLSQKSVDINNEKGSVDQGEEQAKEVSGKIIVDNGQASTTDGFVIMEGASVFDLMKKLQNEGKISFEYKDSNMGAFIESINEIENDNKTSQYWMLYANGELTNVGVSDYIIFDNDILEWKYVDTSEMSF